MSRKHKGKVSGNCPLCGLYREYLAVDHIVPRWKFRAGIVVGDPEADTNIQYICDNCHADKTRLEMKADNPSKRPEVREKIKQGIKRTNWQPTEEWRARQSASHTGLKLSAETKAKIVEKNKVAWATIRRRTPLTQQERIDRAQRKIDRLKALLVEEATT